MCRLGLGWDFLGEQFVFSSLFFFSFFLRSSGKRKAVGGGGWIRKSCFVSRCFVSILGGGSLGESGLSCACGPASLILARSSANSSVDLFWGVHTQSSMYDCSFWKIFPASHRITNVKVQPFSLSALSRLHLPDLSIIPQCCDNSHGGIRRPPSRSSVRIGARGVHGIPTVTACITIRRSLVRPFVRPFIHSKLEARETCGLQCTLHHLPLGLPTDLLCTCIVPSHIVFRWTGTRISVRESLANMYLRYVISGSHRHSVRSNRIANRRIVFRAREREHQNTARGVSASHPHK